MKVDTTQIHLDLSSLEDYRRFLQIKKLPTYSFHGRMAEFPSEYAERLGLDAQRGKSMEYSPLPGLWDYQLAITKIAIEKQKFAVFADCGLGKTLILLEYSRHAQQSIGPAKRVLIVSPLMVVQQTMRVVDKFYRAAGFQDFAIEQVRAKDLSRWINETGSIIGITNYEALQDTTPQGRLGALILDESSMLKSHYGKHGQQCLRLGKGLSWKLCCSGTPAPNDRIEFANHAVFLDAFPTINSFLAKFFVNRGQTSERWEIKPHAVESFYRALSHWSIFLTNPATYGWKDNSEGIPSINVHIEDVDLTIQQSKIVREMTGTLFPCDIGGITKRSKLSQLAKGRYNGQNIGTEKPRFIKNLIDSWPSESTIIWCLYNEEQALMERTFPDAASIAGSTPIEERLRLIEDFQLGRKQIMISKGKVIGFGLNLQIATRHIFSGLQDSYETFYQCVKRSNRYGSTIPLNVHIPVSDVERPMIETVLRNAKRVQEDTEIQEQLFKRESGYAAQ